MEQVSLSKSQKVRQNYQDTKAYHQYVDGNTVRKINPKEQPVRKKQIRRKTKAKPDIRASLLPLSYLFVMMIFIAVGCLVLISYVNLQSDITNRIEHISSMESELNNLKLANDETYTKIMSGVDLEEIKKIAINELGMKYAKEGQVITYNGEGSDYVRQFSDIPD